MEFSGQEYWSGLPFPTPGDLPNPGIELVSLTSLALAGRFFTTWEAHHLHMLLLLLSHFSRVHGSPPGSPVPGILQARTLKWVAISFSNAGK